MNSSFSFRTSSRFATAWTMLVAESLTSSSLHRSSSSMLRAAFIFWLSAQRMWLRADSCRAMLSIRSTTAWSRETLGSAGQPQETQRVQLVVSAIRRTFLSIIGIGRSPSYVPRRPDVTPALRSSVPSRWCRGSRRSRTGCSG